jgi:acetyl esterase/lipase
MDATTVGWLFLGASAIGAAFTASALLQLRRLSYFTFPYFMAGWLTSELALHHLAWQVLASLGFIAAGALASAPGRAGLALTLLSWLGLLVAWRRAHPAGEAARAALRSALGEVELRPTPARPRANPFRFRRPGVERIRDVAYGDPLPGDRGRRNQLDVFRSETGGDGRPVLLQVHGGAWVIGDKEQQGQPLVNHLAERGWLCFAQNYRLAPRAPFPAQIVDVKRCLAWVRANAERFGGDPGFVCITGGSAGGHLSSLAALTAGDRELQPGFEDADTSVAACVPFYGVYDFLDRDGFRGRQAMAPFLERYVLRCPPGEARARWEAASPLYRVHADAPPFLVIHGTHDSLAWVEEARAFVAALRAVSRAPVVYLEVPGAQHAFDTFHSVRCAHALAAVETFLEHVRAGRGRAEPQAPAREAAGG